MFADLMALPGEMRRDLLGSLAERDLVELMTIATREGGTPYSLWLGDPVGFVQQVCGESLWSRQREILDALVSHQRVAVPSCFGSGKTWLSGRIVSYHCCVHPPGTALAVTTATRFRQVARQIWPTIRRVVTAAKLPGKVDATQWKMSDDLGMEQVVAYGFSAPEWDESAVQGIHAPHLLIVIDEGGGIGRTIGGALRGLLVGEYSRMLVIGNPPTDDEGSWFEGICTADSTVALPIPASATPNFTDEQLTPCRTCPPAAGRHSPAVHLIDQQWVDETVREYGADSAYVAAKVHARFPRGGPGRIIPSAWVDAATELLDPLDDTDYVRLDSLGLPGEHSDLLVKRGSWVRLGVDVAADGGDEMSISRIVGDLATIQHVSSGAANASAVSVAGTVLEHIHAAQVLAKAIGSTQRIHVKVDGIGLGWGVASILIAWGQEGLHEARIVPVIVSEKPDYDDVGARMRPLNKRSEMWIAGRHLLEPNRSGRAAVRLAVDRRTAAQLSSPRYGSSTGGLTTIESKVSMRQRGLASPDRGESVLLGLYEVMLQTRGLIV
jgi:hypothetical protein